MKENDAHPSLPDGVAAEVLKGLYRIAPRALRPMCGCWGRARSCARYSPQRSCCAATSVSMPRSGAPPATANCSATRSRLNASIVRTRSLIAPHIKASLHVLGTDGFGRSDTREQLRGFFEVDRHHVVLAALDALVQPDGSGRERCAQTLQRYGLGVAAPALGGEKPLDRRETAFARSAQARCESVSGLEGSSEQQPVLPLGVRLDECHQP